MLPETLFSIYFSTSPKYATFTNTLQSQFPLVKWHIKTFYILISVCIAFVEHTEATSREKKVKSDTMHVPRNMSSIGRNMKSMRSCSLVCYHQRISAPSHSPSGPSVVYRVPKGCFLCILPASNVPSSLPQPEPSWSIFPTSILALLFHIYCQQSTWMSQNVSIKPKVLVQSD